MRKAYCAKIFKKSQIFSNNECCSSIREDQNIKSKQLVPEKYLNKENKMNYQQAYRFCKKLQNNIFGNKKISFLKILVLIEKMQSNAYVGLQIDKYFWLWQSWVLLQLLKMLRSI